MSIRATEESLRRQLSELEDRLTKVRSDMSSSHSADFAEQVTERENDEVLQAIAEETEASMTDIRAALARIHEGTYGLCTACGEAVSPERLAALPEAALCLVCANKA